MTVAKVTPSSFIIAMAERNRPDIIFFSMTNGELGHVLVQDKHIEAKHIGPPGNNFCALDFVFCALFVFCNPCFVLFPKLCLKKG